MVLQESFATTRRRIDMAYNIVIRECEKCGYYGDDRKTFSYCGDGVWSCPNCCSKYTRVREVIDSHKSRDRKN